MTAAPRRFRSLLLASLLALTGCPGAGGPPSQPVENPPVEQPRVMLQGQLTPAPDTEVSGPVRLALAWYPGLLSETSGPLSQPRSILTEEVAYSGTFPASYTFEVKSAPPAEALVQLGEGMQGKGAVGILLAYSDRNGNATLDTIPAHGTPVDHVLGASLAWSQPSAFLVLYLDSAQEPSTGLKQGFNLVRLTDHLTSDVVPLTTPIPLGLHEDPLLDAFVCEAAWDDTAEQSPCGLTGEQPEEDVLTLQGEVLIHGTQAEVSLEVRRDDVSLDDARVTVAGQAATYDASRSRYTLHLEDTALLDSGLVTVTAHQGDAELSRTVTVPADFQVTWPTLPMSYSPGRSVLTAWTGSQGASRYDVSVLAGDQVLAREETENRGVTLVPQAYQGAAAVRIEGISEEGDGLVVRRVREVPISFTACDTKTEGSQLTVEGWYEKLSDLSEWESSEVRAEVKDDGVPVTDAKVTLEGWDVPYLNEVGAFSNGFLWQPGYGLTDTVELRVMRGDAVLCRTLTLPGEFHLTLEGPPERKTGSPLAVSWTRAPDAGQYELRLLDPALNTTLYTASTNALDFTFDRVDAVGNLTLRVSAVTQPAHNDTLGWMDVKRLHLGGVTFTQ